MDLFDETANQAESPGKIENKMANKKARDIQRGSRLITAEGICAMSSEDLQSAGITFRKVEYIKDFAGKVQSGTVISLPRIL